MESTMQHVRIAMYDIKDGAPQELVAEAHHGLLRTFREQAGYLRDHLVPLSDRRFVSITFWDSREAANSAIGVAGAWVRETVADRIDLRSPDVRVVVRSDDASPAI
jgi:hypothetical protein